MYKIKLILLAVLTMLSVSLFATDYPWLTFVMRDNAEVSVAAENLSIEYKDFNLILKSATVEETIPVAQISTMRFTSIATAVNEIDGDRDGFTDFYTVSGLKVGSFESAEAARQNLPSGIYIGKNESKTFKVIF